MEWPLKCSIQLTRQLTRQCLLLRSSHLAVLLMKTGAPTGPMGEAPPFGPVSQALRVKSARVTF